MMNIRNSHPLSLAEIGQLAPSALAVNPHASRSARYTYIPTAEIIRGMETAGFFPYSASQSRTRDLSRQEFTKHMLRFRREADMQRAAIVGELVSEIVLVNAHDGSAAYNLMAGIWRFICSNGMMVSDSTLPSVHVQHKGDIVGQVIEGSLAIADQSGRTLEQVNNWQRLQLTAGEQHAFASAAHVLRFGDSEGHVDTPIKPEQLLHIRRTADTGSDLWRTFNRVQENVIRGGLHGVQRDPNEQWRVRRMSTRAVKGIDQDVKLNRALWQLAESMADLKNGGGGLALAAAA